MTKKTLRFIRAGEFLGVTLVIALSMDQFVTGTRPRLTGKAEGYSEVLAA